jgi:succinate-semialdehyde dehydrogenase/glutarate-semialdehyde dehydrogenase
MDDVYDEFVAGLTEIFQGLQPGDPSDPSTRLGPLSSERAAADLTAQVQDAVDKGATVLAGGERIGESGNFWKPTILADVPLEAKVFNDEPFGPLAAIRSFNTLEEAIAEANRLSFGLAGYAFTKSLKNADLLTRKVEVGMLWVNMPAMPSAEMPFGGIKDSGYGSEGGPEAMEAYLNTRAIAIANV